MSVKRQRVVVGASFVGLPSTLLSIIFSSSSARDWNSLGRVSGLFHTESHRIDASPVEITVRTFRYRNGKVSDNKDLFRHTFARHHPKRIALWGTCDSSSVLQVLGRQRHCQQLELRCVDLPGSNVALSSLLPIRTLRVLRISMNCFNRADLPAFASCRQLHTLDINCHGPVVRFPDLVLLPTSLTSLSFRSLDGPFDDLDTIAHLCSMPLRELTLHLSVTITRSFMPGAHFLQLLRGLPQLTMLDFDISLRDLPPLPLPLVKLQIGKFAHVNPLLRSMLPHLEVIHMSRYALNLRGEFPELLGPSIRGIHFSSVFHNLVPDPKLACRVRSFSLSYRGLAASVVPMVPTSDFTSLETLRLIFSRARPFPNPLERFPVLASVQSITINGGCPAKFVPHIVRCFPNLQTIHLEAPHCRLPHCFPATGPGSMSALEGMPSLRRVAFFERDQPLTPHLLHILADMKKLRQLTVPKPKDAARQALLQSIRPLCNVDWALTMRLHM